MSEASLALAIDLGGSQIRAALVNEVGTILARAAEPTRATAGPAAVIAQIAALAAQVCGPAERLQLVGAGVSSPGPLDTAHGIALDIPTLAGFVDYPLGAALRQALAMPVVLENDGISAAIGEWVFGAGKGRANLVYVTVSTGIGGGVISDNRVLRGRMGLAGHVGHMPFVRGGSRCFCGNHGCFEAYASGSAFTVRAIQAAAENQTMLGRDGARIDAPAVFAADLAGDKLAGRLIDEHAQILGEGFAGLLHLYSPDVLVMGGGLSNAFGRLRQGILESLQQHAIASFRSTPIVPAGLGINSGLIGAASLAFQAAATA